MFCYCSSLVCVYFAHLLFIGRTFNSFRRLCYDQQDHTADSISVPVRTEPVSNCSRFDSVRCSVRTFSAPFEHLIKNSLPQFILCSQLVRYDRVRYLLVVASVLVTDRPGIGTLRTPTCMNARMHVRIQTYVDLLIHYNAASFPNVQSCLSTLFLNFLSWSTIYTSSQHPFIYLPVIRDCLTTVKLENNSLSEGSRSVLTESDLTAITRESALLN